MSTITNFPLMPILKLGISSALTAYALYESSKEDTRQMKSKTKFNQKVFSEAIILSNEGQLDYEKCIELILKMEGLEYENLG